MTEEMWPAGQDAEIRFDRSGMGLVVQLYRRGEGKERILWNTWPTHIDNDPSRDVAVGLLNVVTLLSRKINKIKQVAEDDAPLYMDGDSAYGWHCAMGLILDKLVEQEEA